ncbi:retrotransposon hot spot (RHS) protein, putative, partial [Trypanosoma cruzi]
LFLVCWLRWLYFMLKCNCFFVLRHGAQYVVHTVWISLFLLPPVIFVRIFFLPYPPFDWSLVFSFNSIQPIKQGETIPPKRNRVQGGNAKSRASAAPRVGRGRRARPESEGETDQPAATRRRLEGMYRPQWTMSSTVKDILLEGSTNRTEMKLNYFLAMELDGRGAMDTNRSVLLKEFFKDPKKYICDAGVLKEIQATGAYATMERAVREEMDLEEGIRRLHKNGVDNLLTWSEAAEEVTAT